MSDVGEAGAGGAGDTGDKPDQPVRKGPFAFFTLDDFGAYEPTPYAKSAWSDGLLNGPSVVAAAARELEQAHGREGFQPSRLTVDLFSQVRFEPLTIRTEGVREGNRIVVADAFVEQGGKTVARATLVQLRRGEQPPGEVWLAGRSMEPPAEAEAVRLAGRSRGWFGSVDSDGAARPWSRSMGDHQGADRKRFWLRPLDVVADEEASPFQRSVTLGESTSLMAHWGSEGIGFINADLTVALARLPRTADIGIEADEHISDSGVAVGTATLFDRDGTFGTGTVVAVSNAGRQIDFSQRGLISDRRKEGSDSGTGPGSGSGPDSDTGSDSEKGMRV